jgi:hypothetical protein
MANTLRLLQRLHSASDEIFEVETIVPTTKNPHPLLLVEDRCVL